MISMSSINDESSINENILQKYKIYNNKKNKYSKKFIFFFILISFFIILITLFLVLYFKFGLSQYKQDNIIENFYQPNQIRLYCLMKKNMFILQLLQRSKLKLIIKYYLIIF